jgi:hypothetical protein
MLKIHDIPLTLSKRKVPHYAAGLLVCGSVLHFHQSQKLLKQWVDLHGLKEDKAILVTGRGGP